ncbi:hypothetical protein O181_009040 [Austropuccinia psidii MF-1]|uniref:Uncharacterized protein n=1 Tax=Austropuccinia psidii MF-1 TaxID=1389203 RepID=A0A9Q3BQI8_9BASI|nr:hypothetical protein [Austropuccinia psidii MF-1]
MVNLQDASYYEASRPPSFKNPSMKEPEFLDWNQPFKVRSFIQSCESYGPSSANKLRKEFVSPEQKDPAPGVVTNLDEYSYT